MDPNNPQKPDINQPQVPGFPATPPEPISPVMPNIPQETPMSVPQPETLVPPTPLPTTPQPVSVSPLGVVNNTPIEPEKKSFSLMNLGLILMAVVIIIALGYIAYVKFVGNSTTPEPTPIDTTSEETQDVMAPVDEMQYAEPTTTDTEESEELPTEIPAGDNPDEIPTIPEETPANP